MGNLAEMVKLHRKKSGLTQKELADVAGVGKTFVFDLENGKTSLRFDNLLKVLTVLNISVNFKGVLDEES